MGGLRAPGEARWAERIEGRRKRCSDLQAQPPGDHHPLDFAGPLADLEYFGVPIMARDQRVVEETSALGRAALHDHEVVGGEGAVPEAAIVVLARILIEAAESETILQRTTRSAGGARG